jgi:predicted phosphodiesterase
MSNFLSKTDLCRKYRDEYGMEMPTLKLARIIYENEPLLFNKLETVRTCLRSIEGKSGNNRKDYIPNIPYKMENRLLNPYSLPKAEEVDYTPYTLQANRVIIMSDIHLPYHCVQSLTAAMEMGVKMNVDAILLNGDTLDFFTLSRFAKDPKARSFAEELKMFEEFMKVLKNTFPKAQIYFKHGNHEERYNHYLWMKAGELEGVNEFKIDEIIQRRAPGVIIIGDKRIIKMGDLNVIHGHEFGGNIFSPVNIARGLFLKAKVAAMQGHNHQTSEHTERDMNGRITTTYSLGCLCQLSPAYLPLNKWNNGAAIVEMQGNDFNVTNFRINEGKIM